MFDTAWEHQDLFTSLQNKINDAIQDMQLEVTRVLESSTRQTLKQYEDHVEDIEDKYRPLIESFSKLRPGECRNHSESILNTTTTSLGFRASNCANSYDQRVRVKLESTTRGVDNFDDIFYHVQTVVVRSFIGRNVFLTPEEITTRIVTMYDVVKNKWEDYQPEMDAVTKGFADAIAAQNTELGNCHHANLDFAAAVYRMIETMIDTCKIFDDTQSPFVRGSRMVQAVSPSKHLLEEFEAEIEKYEPYVWKA